MDIIKSIVNKKVLLHTLFWLTLLLIVYASENWQFGRATHWSMLFQFVVPFAIFAAISYFNVYFLIVRFFSKKKYWQYTLLLFLTMTVGAVVSLLVKILSQKIGLLIPDIWKYHDELRFGYFFHILFGEFMVVAATTFFFLLVEWIRLQNVTIQLKEIESQKNQSELQILKAQINPHFLFNMLNNIYSHSLDNSPKTPEMILKLSSLMSYILYECQDEKVPVSSELEFIKNYLDLEKYRFEDQLDVRISIVEHKTEKRIVPLLLIPFIENAFKHGGNKGNNKKHVYVTVEIANNEIRFEIINSIDTAAENGGMQKISGIGIENAKKRLELLYPGSYTLLIEKNNNEFRVNLKISEHAN
jgi:hypothetical protein